MKITKIKKDDVIFVSVPVGQMPPARTQTYMEALKKELKKVFNNEVLMVASRDVDRGYEFEILRKD